MTIAALATYGTYTPHHSKLRKLGHSPSECDVFGKIANLISNLGEAFVSLGSFSNDLGYSRETICRAVTSLEKKGRIKKTGIKRYGFFPYVEILEAPQEKEELQPVRFDAPLIKPSTIIDHNVNAHCPNGQSQERTKELKKQTAEKIVCSKNSLEEQEETPLRKKLQSYGISKNQAKRLMGKFDVEKIQAQLDQLDHLLERGDQIKSPAAWLVSAIQRDYKPCAEIVKQKEAVQEANQRQKYNDAQRLLQDAKWAENEGKIEQAKTLAEKSLTLIPQNETRELLAKVEAALLEQEQLAKARGVVPQSEQARIFEECLKSLRANRTYEGWSEKWLRNIAQTDAEQIILARAAG